MKLQPFWRAALAVIAVLLFVFLIYPVFFVLKKAFFPIDGFSLAFFKILFGHQVLVQSMVSSFVIGIVVTLLCIAVSFPLAWVATRYRLPLAGLWSAVIMIPMILPPFVGAIGMKQFLARFGTLNLLLMKGGLIESPIDWLAGGFWGVVILQVLHLFPIVYLNLSASLANIDPALEEAAWNLGATRSAFFRKIILPLAIPGLFAGAAIVFIWSVTDLGTPLILEYRNVVAYQIYNMINDIYENPLGYALVLFLLGWIALVYFGSKAWFLRRKTVMSTKAVRSGALLHTSKPLLTLSAIGFLGVGLLAVTPHLMVIFSSLSRRWFMTILPEDFTFEYFGTVFEHPLTFGSIRNSIFLASNATLVACVIGLIAAYLISRYRFWGRSLLDFITMLPLALPGLVIAFGYVGSFAGTPLDPRQNPFPLLIAAYAVRRLPFMVRSVDAGLRQIDPAMEEAALNLGATHGRTLSRITLPLLTANIVAGSILVFAFSMLEVSDSLILAMKENYYPLTKAIYALVNRIADGFGVGSALGVLAMILLAGSLIVAGKILGRKMGELFRM